MRRDRDYVEILSGLQTLQAFGYDVNVSEVLNPSGQVVASEPLVTFQYVLLDLLTQKQEVCL